MSTATIASRYAGWTGWCRTADQPWRQICQAETREDALVALLRAADRLPGGPKDLAILPIGQDSSHLPTRSARNSRSGRSVMECGNAREGS
jgi:hypothetical protein